MEETGGVSRKNNNSEHGCSEKRASCFYQITSLVVQLQPDITYNHIIVYNLSSPNGSMHPPPLPQAM